MRGLVVGLVVSLLASATPAYAEHGAGALKPGACSKYTWSSASKVIGTWYLRQKDDSGDWSGPWTVVFNANGTWSENGTVEGSWCQNGDMIFFGFSEDPNTMYRGTVYNRTVQGEESWNQLGTGIFELTR